MQADPILTTTVIDGSPAAIGQAQLLIHTSTVKEHAKCTCLSTECVGSYTVCVLLQYKMPESYRVE